MRLLGHFLGYGFYKVFSYKLKPCKDRARELNRVSGDWSTRVKAASGLLNLVHKEFIARIEDTQRKHLWEAWYLWICPSSDY